MDSGERRERQSRVMESALEWWEQNKDDIEALITDGDALGLYLAEHRFEVQQMARTYLPPGRRWRVGRRRDP
jgi:hypothetical protein